MARTLLFSLFCCALFLLFNLHASARLVFEDGYTVSTVLDGNKLNVNPHSVLPDFGSSLIVLDSTQSALFTVSFSPSQDSKIKRLSGEGVGFSDGDLATAMFNKPKSFAVDLKGNVYVADRGNFAIRKISKSGVTTIAGGSKTPGKADGPGRNASFSTDFEVAFIPERCVLMICDHGHKLVHQINLKSEDCAGGSHSDSEVLETKEITKSQMFAAEQLKDLMTFDEVAELPESADEISEQVGNRTDVLSEGHQRVDNMIYANIMGFEDQGKGAPLEEPSVSISGLVRRR